MLSEAVDPDTDDAALPTKEGEYRPGGVKGLLGATGIYSFVSEIYRSSVGVMVVFFVGFLRP